MFDDVLKPDYENSIYNLASSISEILGVKKGKPLKNFEINEKLVFVLVDALGENIFQKLGINMEHETITSVFPSTTCTALTTLVTADKPANHGIIGYIGYDKISGKLINLLDFKKEYSNKNEKESINRIFLNVTTITSVNDKKIGMVLPFFSLNAPLVEFLAKNSEIYPYINIWDGILNVYNLYQKKYDFIFYYIPYVDMISHIYGPYSEATILTARETLDIIIKYLKKIDYDVIISADHGQINISEVKMLNSTLIDRSITPVRGDTRMHIFNFKNNLKFEDENYAIYEYEKIKDLFGGDGVIDKDISVGIALNKNIYLTEITKDENINYQGSHSSILREEMEVPLINMRKVNI